MIQVLEQPVTLEKLQKMFLERYEEALTGSKLSSILKFSSTIKNHIVALNMFRPTIFDCKITADGKTIISVHSDAIQILQRSKNLLTHFLKNNV